MKHDDRFNELTGLSDWQLENEDQDIRGCPVRSRTGESYGKIEDMLVDKDGERVVAVRMDDGRLVGVEHLDIHDDSVTYRDTGPAADTRYTRVRTRSV